MPATTLPDYEVLVRHAREVITSIPPLPATAGKQEIRDHDLELRIAVNEALNAGADEAERRRAAGRLRAVAGRALDPWEPAIDTLVDATGAAAFLRFTDPGSVAKRRQRARRDGTPGWPEPDQTLGRSDGWTLRTIIGHLALETGRGMPGVPRGPRKKKTAGR